MRVIALEEHYRNKAVVAAVGEKGKGMGALRGSFGEAFTQLEDLGAARIADMDDARIDLQVLSHSIPSPDVLEPELSIPLARQANDQAAEAVRQYPARLAAFATLPMNAPDGAAQELERTVTQFSFKGALILGAPQGRFLDDPFFSPVLERAQALDVPLYLHPGLPPLPVWEAYYGGLDEAVAGMLSTAGWGWHAESGLQLLRMIVTGVFDRFPRLQVILGHMGEMIPFMLARTDGLMSRSAKGLKHSVADYVHNHVHITTSGMFTTPPLLCALQVLGADRVMFSVDYPYSSNRKGREFLEQLWLPPQDFDKFTHGNAERLLRIKI